MNADQPPFVCSVQSVTDHVGRRTLKFTRLTRNTAVATIPAKRRKAPVRLKLSVAPEAAFSFEPAIQIRAHAKS